MEQRINPYEVVHDAFQAMLSLEGYLRKSGVEQRTLHLMKLRASQMNGCAYCVDMHSKDLKAGGETDERLFGVVAWHEMPFFTDRERAALAWTEEITNIQSGHASDAAYEAVRNEFNEQEVADLTVAIATINSWNRLALAFRIPPGVYQPRVHATA